MTAPALEGGEGEGGIGNELGPATDIVQPLELELWCTGILSPDTGMAKEIFYDFSFYKIFTVDTKPPKCSQYLETFIAQQQKL